MVLKKGMMIEWWLNDEWKNAFGKGQFSHNEWKNDLGKGQFSLNEWLNDLSYSYWMFIELNDYKLLLPKVF